MNKDVLKIISDRVNRCLFRFGYSYKYSNYNLFGNYFEYGNKVYACRYYKKYFQYFMYELCDLSKNTIGKLNELDSFIFRKKMGILDEGICVSWEDVALACQMKEVNVRNHFKKAADNLISYFIDYSYYHFLEDIMREDIDKRSIYLEELFPFESFSEYNDKYYKYSIDGKYISLHTVGDLCELDTKQFRNGLHMHGDRGTIILHRLHCLGLGLSDENAKDISNVSEKDILLEMPISTLNFSNKVRKYFETRGVYNILGVCLTHPYYWGKGYGEQSKREVIDKIHTLGLTFRDEKEDNIRGTSEFYNTVEDALLKKLDFLQSERASIVKQISQIDSFIAESMVNGDSSLTSNLEDDRKRLFVTFKAISVQINKITYEICNRDIKIEELKKKLARDSQYN